MEIDGKGKEMLVGTGAREYEVRVDYADETFEIVSVPATSPVEATEIARRDPEVVSTTVLRSIGEPETFLAW